MTWRGPLSGKERAARRALAHQVLAEGGTITEFAKRAGLKLTAAWRWLDRCEPKLREELGAGPRGKRIDGHMALVRLLLIQSVIDFRGGRSRLARALGMTPANLSAFQRTWAPDGLDAAIADLMPDEDDAHA